MKLALGTPKNREANSSNTIFHLLSVCFCHCQTLMMLVFSESLAILGLCFHNFRTRGEETSPSEIYSQKFKDWPWAISVSTGNRCPGPSFLIFLFSLKKKMTGMKGSLSKLILIKSWRGSPQEEIFMLFPEKGKCKAPTNTLKIHVESVYSPSCLRKTEQQNWVACQNWDSELSSKLTLDLKVSELLSCIVKIQHYLWI